MPTPPLSEPHKIKIGVTSKTLSSAPLPVTEGLDARSKAVPLRFSVPLGELATGRYDYQVSVLDPAGQKVAFWRAPVVLVP